MHPLLQRQLKRLGLDPEHCPIDADGWRALLERVSQSYVEGDQGRTLLEQSLDVTSREMQDLYEELRRSSETALSTEKDKLEAVLNSLADGLCVVDERWNILMMNPQAEAIFQIPFAQLKGQPIYRLLSPGPEEFSQGCPISDASIPPLTSGIPYRTEDGLLLKADGQLTPISLVVTPVVHEGRISGAVLVFSDVTDKKREAEQEAANAALLRRIQAGLLQLSTNSDIYHVHRSEAYQLITRVAAQTIQVSRASIWLYAREGAVIQCADLYEQRDDHHSSGTELLGATFPQYFSELATGRIIAASQAQTDPRTAEFTESYLAPIGITSMLDIPIRVEGKMVGVMCYEHIGPARRWTLEEEQFAASVANTVSLVLEAVDRRQAEEALRQNEERTRLIIDTAMDAVVSMDNEGLITGWNRQAAIIFGWTTEEVLGRAIADTIVPSQHREGHRNGLQSFLQTGQGPVLNRRIEITALRRDGTEFPVELAITPIQLDTGYVFTAFISDISARLRAQREIEDAQQFLTSMIENLPIMVFAKTAGDLKFVRWNRTAEELTGFSRDEMLGKSDYDFFPQQEADFFVAKDKKVLVDRVLLEIPEEEIHTKHRGIRILRTKKLPVLDEQGKPQFLLGIAEDITERKQADASLRESEEKYRGLFESSSDAIMLLFPPEWTFTSCNPATVELFGANDAAHFTTLGPWDISPERQADGVLSSVKAQQAIETAMREGSHFFEWTHRNLDGHNFPAMVGLARITLQGKQGLQATVRDISEQKRAEHALREQMQLSSLAADINSTLIQNTTLPAMLQQCASALIQHLDAAFARIWLLGPGDLCGACHKAAACANRTECLHLAASAGLSENLNGEFRRIPLGALKIGKIAQGWGTMTTNDVANDDRLPNKQWLRDHQLEAFAGYPLMVGSRVIGVMALFSRHALSPLMLKTLERVAQVISLGVERKQTEEALRKSSAFQKAMLDNAGHAVISTTPEGIIRLFNPAAEALLGYSADELIGKQTPSLLHVPEEVAARAQLFSEELGIELHPGFDVFVEKSRRNLPNEHEWTYIRKDGTRLTVLLNITALRDADGQISGFLGIASDITLLKIAERELISAKETAESASVAKSQFLANMSHEIRTPMNGVLGMAELLLNTPLTDKQRHLAENVHRSGTALLGVINEILDFSKIEAGKLELERIEFGLRETVEEAVDLFAESAGRKGLNLTCFLPDEIPDRAIGDPGRLRQVLLNLVGNAMKFTPRGNVTVWFHLLAQDAHTLTLKCAVTDTGIGIPPSAQASLFTAFSQADGSTTRQFGGTGLGLAIVKQLVQLMGGEVGLTSAPGQGSTFWFTARLEHAAPGDSAQLENPRFLTGLRVLIVDADPTNLFVLNAPLTAWGAKVISADSGAAALELLSRYANNRTPFDLALVDICMPGMDGLMLARAIKADPALRTVVLLAINSGESQAPGWQTESLGFIAWLQKPVRQSTLRDCLRRHLQGATAAPSTAGATALTPRNIDRRVLLVEDNPVNREVAIGMLELLGYRVDSAENGRQALERSATLPYDLILMDCQMPVMDGFAATAGIRERERQTQAAHIPIIALTANAMAQDREQCLQAGMDDYLSKPFTQQQLKDLLARWISQASKSAPQEAPVVAPATVSSNPSTPVVQPEQVEATGLVDRSAWEPIRMLKRPGHPDPLTKLLATYVEDSRTLVEQLRQAIASKDSARLHALAHRLKSSSATLGALTLAAQCKELETLGRERRIEAAPDRFRELERDFLAVCSIFQAAINKETSHER